MSNQNSLLAKGYYTEHGAPANLLEGWEARKLSLSEITELIKEQKESGTYDENQNLDDCFLVTRSNATTLRVKAGDVVPNAGSVSVDPNGDVIIGKYKVFFGSNLINGWHAKPGRGKSFNVFKENGEKINVKPGEFIENVGEVSLGDDGNLHANGKSIKVLRKTKEIQLLVYKTQAEGGYNAYLNVIEPGSKANRKDGTKGIFIPSTNGQPAKFAERIGEALVTSATFTPDPNKKITMFQMYSINNILLKEKLNSQRTAILDECEKFAITPEDNQEFVLLTEEIESFDSVIDTVPFSINNGHYHFGLQGRSYSRNTGTGYGR